MMMMLMMMLSSLSRAAATSAATTAAPPPALPPDPRAITPSDAFATMCVSNQRGLQADVLERCLLSACCFRAWHLPATPLVSIIDSSLPREARRFLRNVLNATLLQVSSHPVWPRSERYPAPPPRAYTFHKLNVLWRLANFSRVLFFDSDAFFTAPPDALFATYGAARSLAAVHFPDDPAGVSHFNSGLMLLRPSEATHELVQSLWRRGAFPTYRSFEHLTEQDVLIAAFGGRFDRMDICWNYRGRHRPYQRHCPQPGWMVHHYHPTYVAQARARLWVAPAKARCASALAGVLERSRRELDARRVTTD